MLAACLLAFRRGDDSADAAAGALAVAELMTMIRGALTPKTKGRKR